MGERRCLCPRDGQGWAIDPAAIPGIIARCPVHGDPATPSERREPRPWKGSAYHELEAALAAAETRAAEAEEEARIAKHNYDQIVPMIDGLEKSYEAQLQQAREALEGLSRWADRMPDAMLTEDDPRSAWWGEGTTVRLQARTALETPRGEGEGTE